MGILSITNNIPVYHHKIPWNTIFYSIKSSLEAWYWNHISGAGLRRQNGAAYNLGIIARLSWTQYATVVNTQGVVVVTDEALKALVGWWFLGFS